MVFKVSSSDPILPSDLTCKNKAHTPGTFLIPLILCNQDQILNGQCKKLHFIAPAELKTSDQSNLNQKTLCCAKAIFKNGKHTIKIDQNIHDLDFDEIDYSFSHEGKKIAVLHKKGATSIEVLDADEQVEIQAIVQKSLSKEESEKNPLDKSEELSKPRCYSHNPSLDSTLSQVFVLYATLNAAWKKQAASEAQRHIEELKIQIEDAEERSFKKKEARWQLRQKHFEIKDQNRTAILEEARKQASSQFEDNTRRKHQESAQSAS